MLELRGVTKAYPGVVANSDINLKLKYGQILALLGENGAGKSTLMKILYGLVQPDSGRIMIDDQTVVIDSPSTARKLGIGMVQQHFALFDGMTVQENIALGLDVHLSRRALRQRALDVAEQYGLAIDLDAMVLNLSAGEKQRIEIVRTLLGEPRFLILDEPTSVLTPQETTQLFAALNLLKEEGRSIIFISHKLGEVKALCEHATVLRGGRVVAQGNPKQASAEDLAKSMLGTLPENDPKDSREIGEKIVLGVKKLDVKVDEQSIEIDELHLHAGEILGIAGIAGNGQDHLFELLSGEITIDDRRVLTLNGSPIGDLSIEKRRQRGCAFVPEERLGHAAVPDMGLVENCLLSNLHDRTYQSMGRIKWTKVKETAATVAEHFDVRHSGLHRAAGSLSGGNLQKFIVGRELMKKPALLVINQPTWGVDIGAAKLIHKEIELLAKNGSAVVVISQDLDELLTLCDTLAVLYSGRLTKSRVVSDWNLRSLGFAMTGEEDIRA